MLYDIQVDVDYCTTYQDGYTLQDRTGGPPGVMNDDGAIFCFLCETFPRGLEHFKGHLHGSCCSGLEVRVGGKVKVSTPRDPLAGVEVCVIDAVCTECGMELDALDAGCKHLCHDLV